VPQFQFHKSPLHSAAVFLTHTGVACIQSWPRIAGPLHSFQRQRSDVRIRRLYTEQDQWRTFQNLDDASLRGRFSKDELDAFAAAKDVWRGKMESAEEAYNTLVNAYEPRNANGTKKKAKKQ
jgi:hypothetical protein